MTSVPGIGRHFKKLKERLTEQKKRKKKLFIKYPKRNYQKDLKDLAIEQNIT